MDLTASIVPKSDQINADDLMAGPITVTIREVAKGASDRPVDVHLVEYPGRAYRPSKSMLRVMVVAWGAEASAYAGRKLELIRNPEIAFGGVKLGGIEIAAMSHIEKTLTIALTTTRGKRKDFIVKPLAVEPERGHAHWVGSLSAAKTLDELQALWADATHVGVTKHADVLAAKDARKAELNA